jgi:hypothetical protein
MRERSVFTGGFKERAVKPALKTDRKRPEIAQDIGSKWFIIKEKHCKYPIKREKTGSSYIA